MRYEIFKDNVKLSKLGLVCYAVATDRTGIFRSH